MVRLAEVIQAPSGDFALRNQITSKHLDFVICDRDTTRPILAVELNDSSHTRADRQARDAFLAEAMKQAGIPLIFQKVARSYSLDQLRASINAALGTTRASS